MNKKAQQEIVGFVLIVVLVVVGLMAYLTISLRGPPENDESPEVENILNALMKHTTDCALFSAPHYEDYEDLFRSAYQGESCNNLDETALDYLNQSIREVLRDMMITEARIKGYEFQFFEEDGAGILMFSEGNTSRGSINSAQRSLVSVSDDIVIRLKTYS